MLIKKGEIVTFLHGYFGDQDRPMVAIKDFDLDAVVAKLTEGMDVYDCREETSIITERLEDLGLMQPVPHTLIIFSYDDDSLTIERKEDDPRVTEMPVIKPT